MIETWAATPFDWFKFRLGDGSDLSPADFYPQAIFQSYVVAGRPDRTAIGPTLAILERMHLHVDRPDQVGSWWAQYRALLDEQERLAPGLMEDWNDYETAAPQLEHELAELLENGGGIINLWQDHQLVGHISWRPYSYREQLIQRCWHIHNIVVKPSHRRQGLGVCLYRLALARMNLEATPVVAGLIKADNEASLKTAVKLGRGIVDSYVIVPNVKRET
jgi:predicted acetyltransferase